MAVNQYGYGTAPNQGGGYYEQQTPVGSFAAANQQYGTAGAPVQNSMYSNNPYIGMQGPSIGNNYGANPYVGGTTQQATAYTNPMAGMNNPYLDNAISAAQGDITKSFQNTVMPGLSAQAQASGSFGNTGIQQMQSQAYNDLSKNLGNVANSMRMQDYTAQQQLAENNANRQTQNSQFNSGLNAGDLSRNMQGTYQGQGMGMQADMFNASGNRDDIGRNMGATAQMGMFNAGNENTIGMFNSGQNNDMSKFNAGQGNSMNMYNAGAGNAMLNQYRQNQYGQGQFDATMGQRRSEFDRQFGEGQRQFDTNQGNWNRQFGEGQRQFDETLDRNIYNDSMGWANTAQNNEMNMMDRLMNWNNQGQGWAGNIQNAPMNYWQQFSNGANQFGNAGGSSNGSNSTPYYQDPLMAGMGGYQFGQGMWNSFNPYSSMGPNNWSNVPDFNSGDSWAY